MRNLDDGGIAKRLEPRGQQDDPIAARLRAREREHREKIELHRLGMGKEADERAKVIAEGLAHVGGDANAAAALFGLDVQVISKLLKRIPGYQPQRGRGRPRKPPPADASPT